MIGLGSNGARTRSVDLPKWKDSPRGPEASLRGKKQKTSTSDNRDSAKPSGEHVTRFIKQGDLPDAPLTSFTEKVVSQGYWPGAGRQSVLPPGNGSFTAKYANQQNPRVTSFAGRVRKGEPEDLATTRELLELLAKSEPGKNWLFGNLDLPEEKLIRLAENCLHPKYTKGQDVGESFYKNLLYPAYKHNLKFGKIDYSNKVPDSVLALLTEFAVENLPDYLIQDSHGIKLLELAFARESLGISNKKYEESLAQLLILIGTLAPNQIEKLATGKEPILISWLKKSEECPETHRILKLLAEMYIADENV